MKTLVMCAAAMLAAFPASAFAQEAEEDELTPAEAMELLADAHRMMGKAEELLNDSSRGKALETQKELLRKLERELKDDPAALQKRILEKVGKLVEKAEKKEKDAVDKLAEVIKKAKSSSGSQPQGQKQQQDKKPASQRQQPGEPAKKAYDPNRTDPPSAFKSRATQSGSWGHLPAAARAAILAAEKEDVPPEFQEIWRKYYEMLEKSGR